MMIQSELNLNQGQDIGDHNLVHTPLFPELAPVKNSNYIESQAIRELVSLLQGNGYTPYYKKIITSDFCFRPKQKAPLESTNYFMHAS